MFGLLRRALLLATVVAVVGCQTPVESPEVIVSEPTSTTDPDWPTLQTNDGATRVIDPNNFAFTGRGTVSWPDGRVQRGEWVDGVLNGQGELVEASGATYRGQWSNGKRQGTGQQHYANGDAYEGTWDSDMRAGNGQHTSAGGTVYQGEWRDDQRNGQGVSATQRGRMYDGGWVDDKEHGYGKALFPNRVRYEGMWEAGQRNGFGAETRPDGSRYEGEWANDQPHGGGKEIYPDGSAHEGEWSEGHVLGHGTRTRPSGIAFTGGWVKDRITQGLVAFPDGTTHAGALFKDGGRVVAAEFLNFLTENARLGSAHAQYLLGLAYLDYDTPEENLVQARHWLTRAAEQDNAGALYRLAALDWENDWSVAKPRLERAAELGHASANLRLGQYRYIGHHYARDHGQAIGLFERAAAKGDLQATNNLAWTLATTSTSHADPERAARILEPLVMYLASWQLLDSYAAAQARLGRFDLARSLQARAIEEAQQAASSDEPLQLENMRARLAMYESDTPFIE